MFAYNCEIIRFLMTFCFNKVSIFLPPPTKLYEGNITARKQSLGQGNVFTPVCHSVHRGGAFKGRGCLHPGVSAWGVSESGEGWADPPPEHCNKWAMCILLECILVSEAYVILSGGKGFPLWTETHPPPNRDLPSGLTFSGGH